jgi:hypothetical protein
MDVARAKRASPSPWTAEGRKVVCVSGIKPCREIVARRGVLSGSPESASATSAIVKPLPTINTVCSAPKVFGNIQGSCTYAR